MSEDTFMVFYAIRNEEGRYFRAKGYGGYGKSWVDDLQKARIYSRPGPARAQITFFSEHYPQFGIPSLVLLHVTRYEILNESLQITNKLAKKKQRVLQAQAKATQCQIDDAKRRIDELTKKISVLKQQEK